MSASKGTTIGEALRKASLSLGRAGIEQPRDEAEILMAHLQGWDRLKLFLERSAVLDEGTAAVFWPAIDRRAGGEPLAYITGVKEFYGLDFAVNRAVLVPRPETELLVDAVLEWARTEKRTLLGVDLGCGSGNLVVTLARHLPGARFYAVDLSPDALQLAERNALRHGVHQRIRFMKGDFLNALSPVQPPPLFNLVVSNPPYLREAELKHLPPTVRDHEPVLSLNGGPDGLAAYRSILEQLPRFISSPGIMVLETDSTRGNALLSLCREQSLFSGLVLQNDYRDLPRVITGLF